MLTKIEMLTLKNESCHLQNVLLSWNAVGSIPNDMNEYEKLYRSHKEQMMMKVLQEREILIDQLNKQKVANEIRR